MKPKFNKQSTKEKKQTRIERLQQDVKIIQTSETKKSVKKAKSDIRLYVLQKNIITCCSVLITLILSQIPTFFVASYRSSLLMQTYLSDEINAKTLWAVQENLQLANIIIGVFALCGLLFTYSRMKNKKFEYIHKIIERYEPK